MFRFSRIRLCHGVAALALLGLWYACPIPTRAAQAGQPVGFLFDDAGKKDDGKKEAKKDPQEKKEVKDKKGDKKSTGAKKAKVRWGQRPSETDAEYDKRFALLMKRIKQEKKGDYSGGQFYNEKDEEVRFWTHKGSTFYCRSDISQEFAADLVMYMEMLHRDYSEVYQRILREPARVREPIEVIVFGNRITYLKSGANPGSGGFFTWAPNRMGDRGEYWPCKHFRLVQFTDGVTDFAKWPKGVLKHEAAHMELQLRMGFTRLPNGEGYAVVPPIWYTEGQATVFEYWDFNKTVDENLAEIPDRGRYAPFIRRMFGTDQWNDFDYLRLLNMQTWNQSQMWFNYCQAWALTAYMFTDTKNGHRDFRRIMAVTQRVGENSQAMTSNQKVVEKDAWENTFPAEDREVTQKNWYKWIEQNVPRDKTVRDEELHLRRMGFNPAVVTQAEPFRTEEEVKANQEWIKAEEARRKRSKVVEW